MRETMETLIALLAAMNAALGAPANTTSAPDRPAIVQPAAQGTLVAPSARLNAIPALGPAVLPANGSETATPAATRNDSVEVKGTIQNIRGAVVFINNQPIVLDPNVQVKGALVVGAYVQVEGTQVGNVLFAREIEVQSADDSAAEPTETRSAPTRASETLEPKTPETKTEIKGAIQAMRGNLIFVNGRAIQLGPNTKVQGQLQVGAYVEIEVVPNGAGGFIAREVEVKTGDDSKQKSTETPEVKRPSATAEARKEIEIKGTLQAIQGNMIVINGQRIALDPGVKIRGALVVGATVEIEATQIGAGIVAHEIEVKNSVGASPQARETSAVKSSDDKNKGSDDSKIKSGDSKKEDKHDDKDDDDKDGKKEDKKDEKKGEKKDDKRDEKKDEKKKGR